MGSEASKQQPSNVRVLPSSTTSPAQRADVQKQRWPEPLASSEVALKLAKAYIRVKNEQSSGANYGIADYLRDNEKISQLLASCTELDLVFLALDANFDLLKQEEDLLAVCSALSAIHKILPVACPACSYFYISSRFFERTTLRMELDALPLLEKYSIVMLKDDTEIRVDELIHKSLNQLFDAELSILEAIEFAESITYRDSKHPKVVLRHAASDEKLLRRCRKLISHNVEICKMNNRDEGAISFLNEALDAFEKLFEINSSEVSGLRDLMRSYRLGKKKMVNNYKLIRENKLLEQQQPERVIDILAEQYRLAVEIADEGYLVTGGSELHEVYKKRVDKLGAEHPDTLLTLLKYACVDYRSYRKPHHESVQVLISVEEWLRNGKLVECRDILDIRFCEAQMLADLGRLEEALEILRQVHEAYSNTLGPTHDVTLETLKEIGQVLIKKREFAEAMKVFEQLHEAQCETLGHDHFKTEDSSRFMTKIEAKIARADDELFMRDIFMAPELFRAICCKQLGRAIDFLRLAQIGLAESSPVKLLAMLLMKLSCYALQPVGAVGEFSLLDDDEMVLEEAEETLTEDLELRTRMHIQEFCKNFSIFGIGVEASHRSDKEEVFKTSAPLFMKILVDQRKEVRGKDLDAPLVDDIWQVKKQFDSASEYAKQGHHEKSLNLYKEVHEKQSKLLGSDDLIVLETEHIMAFRKYKLGQREEANQLLRRVYEKRKRILGPDHCETLRARHALGQTYFLLDKFREALEMFRLNADDMENKFGLNDQEALEAKYWVARCLLHLSNSPLDSFCLSIEVYKRQKETLGENHSETLATKELVSRAAQMLASDPLWTSEMKKHLDSRAGELLRSINRGNVEEVRNLLRESINIARPIGSEEIPPLLLAALRGHVKIVECLLVHAKQRLDKGKFYEFVNVTTSNNGITALHVASVDEHLEMVRLLLAHGAMYNFETSEGQVPIDLAGCEKIIELLKLIHELFEQTREGKTEVMSRVDWLDSDMVPSIFGALNREGRSLIEVAADSGRDDIADELRSKLRRHRYTALEASLTNPDGPRFAYITPQSADRVAASNRDITELTKLIDEFSLVET